MWAAGHPFRARLPEWVHVVDRDDFTYELSPDAVLYARPCRSKAGENDLAMALPVANLAMKDFVSVASTAPHSTLMGIRRISRFAEMPASQRGLDYLAIGDTHSFRDVTANSPVPTVYPGAPEPTNFDEPGAGHVALVALFRRGRRPRIDAEPRLVLALDRCAVP